MKIATAQLGEESVNRAIKLPPYLTAPDGRRFELVAWSPHVEMDSIVTVDLKVIIKMPETDS